MPIVFHGRYSMRSLFFICLLSLCSATHAGLFSKKPVIYTDAVIDLIDGTHLEGIIIERGKGAYVLIDHYNHQKTLAPLSDIKSIQESPINTLIQKPIFAYAVFDMTDGRQLKGVIIERGQGAYVLLDPPTQQKTLVSIADIQSQREMSATERTQLYQHSNNIYTTTRYKHSLQLGSGSSYVSIKNNRYRLNIENNVDLLQYTYKPNQHVALRSKLSFTSATQLDLDDNRSYPGQHAHTRGSSTQADIVGTEANLLLGNNFYRGFNLYLGAGIGLQKHTGNAPIFAHEYGHTLQYLLGVGFNEKRVSIAVEYTDYPISTPMLKYSQDIQTYRSTTFNVGINF